LGKRGVTKIRGIQKINSRWIENPKGRSRQKLGICKKNDKKNGKRQRHHISNGPNRRIHLVLGYKWCLLHVVCFMATSASLIAWWVLSREIATSAYGLINGTLTFGLRVMTISTRLLMNGLYPFGVLIIELPLISGLISGFTPTVIWFISNNMIPQWRLSSVCTAMSVRLPSYLSSLVSFTCYIESSKSYIHTVVYSCTHTFIHTYIHAYKHSCTYNLHKIII